MHYKKRRKILKLTTLPVAGYQECLESFKTQAESYFSGQITLDEAMSGFAQTRQAVYTK